MATIKRYQDLIAWQRAYRLALLVYQVTSDFPSHERFGLTQQLQRAAVSIPSNIAEGFGRHGLPDYIRFLDMAVGSTFEVQTQLLLSRDPGYPSRQDVIDLADEVERVLCGLVRSLRRKLEQQRRQQQQAKSYNSSASAP